jgi:hypothetical protein
MKTVMSKSRKMFLPYSFLFLLIILSAFITSGSTNERVVLAPNYSGLKLPFPAGERYPVSRTMHCYKDGSCTPAIDFGTRRSISVSAMHSGVVDSKTGWDKTDAGGWILVIDHQDGYCSAYMHLSKILVEVGSPPIQQGQIVALSGNTGSALDPPGAYVLHVAVHKKVNNACSLSGASRVATTFDEGILRGGQSSPYSQNHPPSQVTGSIDQPENWNFLNGNTMVRGWAKIEGSSINRIEIYLDYDSNKISEAVYGDSRPDVGGNFGYHWEWNTTQVKDGSHIIKVKAISANGTSSWLPSNGTGNLWVDVRIDNIAPGFSGNMVANSGCGALTNQWQNVCTDPHFIWPAADDYGGSGVTDYRVYWGTDSNGVPTETTNGQTVYHPPQPILKTGSHYLRIIPIDKMGNHGLAVTIFVFRYDITPPSASITIQNGASIANQVNVQLDIGALDTESLPADIWMRISNNMVNWKEMPYQTMVSWSIPALDRHDIEVYLQVWDQAGNLSTIVNDAIYLDLTASAPHSTSYRMCQSVWNPAGSAKLTSTSYSLASAVGEAWTDNGQLPISANFANTAGFLANMDGCKLINYIPPTSGYFINPSVIASGGSLRGNPNYLIGDTIGQSSASEAIPQTSVSFSLTSGFWSRITDPIPARPLNMPNMLGLAPLTETPPPLRPFQPSYFGIAINGNGLYTSQSNIGLWIAAPNVSEMRLSLDPVYANENWRSYSTVANVVLSDTAPESQPQFVYIWFRDLRGEVYGPFADNIWYDRTDPEGSVMILGRDEIASTIGIWLEAYDSLSGVNLMRVSITPDFMNTDWLPYQNVFEWVLADPTNIPVFYAQFQDQAGNLSPIYNSNGGIYIPNNNRVYLPLVDR